MLDSLSFAGEPLVNSQDSWLAKDNRFFNPKFSTAGPEGRLLSCGCLYESLDRMTIIIQLLPKEERDDTSCNQETVIQDIQDYIIKDLKFQDFNIKEGALLKKEKKKMRP